MLIDAILILFYFLGLRGICPGNDFLEYRKLFIEYFLKITLK